jgi:hypothetical protein
MVCCHLLDAADVNGRVHQISLTVILAGMLADIGTNGRKGIILSNQANGIRIALLMYQCDIARNVHVRRTHVHAGHGLIRITGAMTLTNVGQEIITASFQAL